MHRPSPRMMLRATFAALVPALVLAFAMTATAQVTRIHDAQGDGVRILGQGMKGPSANGDIRKVRVDHRDHVLRVKILPHKRPNRGNGVAARYQIWVDTQGAGFPEYVIEWNLETERVYVNRANRFQVGERVCNREMGKYNYRFARVTVPRACLDRPARLRVSVQASDNDTTVRSDWAPGFHRYGLWTRQG